MPKYVHASFEILHSTPNAMGLIERAGRICYKSESQIGPDTSGAFCRMLIKNGHESVLEHASATVKFVVDRGVSHEMVRHRICSFSQESTRFCDYGGKGIVLIHPPGLSQFQKVRRENHFWLVQDLYDQERKEGVRPEITRGVLPTCLKTEMVWTANIREWRHIFKLRTSAKAHPQMREVMCPLLQTFNNLFGVLFEDCEW